MLSLLLAALETPHRACFALEITARPCSTANGRSKSLLGRASKPPSARKRCSSKLLAWYSTAPENTTPALLSRTSHSKSLLGRARQPLSSDFVRASKTLSARKRCSSRLLRIRQHSKTPPVLLFLAHPNRNQYPSVVGSHNALEIIGRV